MFSYLLKLAGSAPVKAFMSPKVTATVWKENVKIADENNHPGKFTAFCSYEWTSMPDNRNLHRNVFFRACDKVPDYPFSALDSKLPTGTVELDGRAAQGGQRAARDLAQRQRQRRLDVPGRHRQHHRAADRRRLGGLARPQRAPGRDQAGQGTIGDASPAVAQRRVRQLRDV